MSEVRAVVQVLMHTLDNNNASRCGRITCWPLGPSTRQFNSLLELLDTYFSGDVPVAVASRFLILNTLASPLSLVVKVLSRHLG